MPDPIRVLCAIGSMDGGGSERQMVGILRHLDRARFVPVLYLISRQGELLDEVPDDVPVYAFWERHASPCCNFPGRIHRMQSRDMAGVLAAERIDVVYDRTFSMTLVAAAATRRRRTGRISTIVSNPRYDVERTAERYIRIKRHMLRRAYREADRVLTVSEGIRQAAIEYYRLESGQVTTAYNFLDLERLRRLADEPCEPLADDRFHLVTAGRLQEEKGYSHLLGAVDELVHRRGCGQLMLHVLGRGRLEAQFRSFVRTHELESHVRLHGFVANPYSIFKRCQLYCLTSLYEGMPNVVLEAMACDLPVLATDCEAGPREILADGRFGTLVPPGDTWALADAIYDSVTHYDAWRERVGPARQHVEQNFSTAAGISRLEGHLEEAARHLGREL